MAAAVDPFEHLHARLDRTRSTSATVTVDRGALAALLAQHSETVGQLDRLLVVLRSGQPMRKAREFAQEEGLTDGRE